MNENNKLSNQILNIFAPTFIAENSGEPAKPAEEIQDDTIRVGNLKYGTDAERRASAKAITEYKRARKKTIEEKKTVRKQGEPNGRDTAILKEELNGTDFGQAGTELPTEVDYWDFGVGRIYREFGEDVEINITEQGTFGRLDILEAKPFKIKGLNIPKDVKRFTTSTRINRRLIKCLVTDTGESKTDSKFWTSGFSGVGNASALSKFARIAPLDKGNVTIEKSTSLRGNSAAKIVPMLEWFPEQLLELDPKELLSIFENAEANTLMLHIGKMAAGAPVCIQNGEKRGSRLVENVVADNYTGDQHNFLDFKYRVGVVSHGEAEVGKSTLWETFVLPAFEKIGYTKSLMALSNNQFNKHGALSDIWFNGDLTSESSVNLQKDSVIKSCISNEWFPLEGKGVDAVDARARATVLVVANHVRFPKIKDLDDGIISRLHFLETKTKNQLRFGKENATDTWTVWNKLRDKYQVSTEVLALYLIRKSLNYFLESIGYTWNENLQAFEKDESANKLNKILAENRKNYKFKTPQLMTDVLTCASVKAQTLSEASGKILPFEYEEGFYLNHLVHLAETAVKIHKKIIECQTDPDCAHRLKFYLDIQQWLFPEKFYLMHDWEKFAERVRYDYNNKSNQSLDEHWKANIKSLVTTKGHELPEFRAHYDQGYTKAKSEKQAYAEQIQELIEKHGASQVTAAVLAVDFIELI